MKRRVQKSINQALSFIASKQEPSGRFGGVSVGSPVDFDGAVYTDTVFFTALIVGCLYDIPASEPFRVSGIRYLQAHASRYSTWNYWERGSTARPYPDDLDDTACAIAALCRSSAATIPAGSLALLAKTLIACEVKAGGPYRTWITTAKDQAWRDIDVAVNANIGYMFTNLGIQSSALECYISDCIRNDDLQSPYYVSSIPTLYFIARWYKGSQLPRLRQCIIDALHKSSSALHKAMMITAAFRTGCAAQDMDAYVEDLLEDQKDGYWPYQALYYEPPTHGAAQYAGSPELTTAFVVEALQSWVDQNSSGQVQHERAPSQVNKRYDVHQGATVMANAIGYNLSVRHRGLLNEASRRGWLAYGIYDDIIDGDGGIEKLGEANTAMRASMALYKEALNNNAAFNGYVDQTFKRMDAALDWEVAHARDPHRLPDYGNNKLLAERSWGHVLASTAVIVLAGCNLVGPEVRSFHEFMHHYLIAKQLCDDVHDWQEDLAHRRISPVVAMLLRREVSASVAKLQQAFWSRTIDDVNAMIRLHIRRAQDSLDMCDFLHDSTTYRGWLSSLAQVCDQAQQKRDEARVFIQAFAGQDLV
jgi:hypothetical protein